MYFDGWDRFINILLVLACIGLVLGLINGVALVWWMAEHLQVGWK